VRDRLGAFDTAEAARSAEAGRTDLGPSPGSGQPVVDRLDLLEERDLVVRARQDPEAFGRLYERHRGRVYRFACSRLRNSYDAEDLTAEVFMRAWQAIERYQPSGAPFGAWLHRIASNAIVDQRRRRRGLVEDIDQHHDLAATGSVEELVAGRDRMRRIGLAVQRLPARQRRVLALRFGHDMTHDAIAERMGRSPGAVKVLQHRAIARVREAVRAAGDAAGAGVTR
jgi:RNA polymerase sigma-70 factor (ECF subfamily)